MYEKPAVVRFGTFRELTEAGATGTSDGRTFEGSGVGPGGVRRVTNGTTDYAFTSNGSR